MKYLLCLLLFVSFKSMGQDSEAMLCYSLEQVGIDHYYGFVNLKDSNGISIRGHLEFKGFGKSQYLRIFMNDQNDSRASYDFHFINGRLVEINQEIQALLARTNYFESVVFTRKMKVFERRHISSGCTRMSMRFGFFSRMFNRSFREMNLNEIIQIHFYGELMKVQIDCIELILEELISMYPENNDIKEALSLINMH